jgi:sugar transferase EpsL
MTKYQFFKGCADRFLAFILLITLSPLLLFASLQVLFLLGSPVLFAQVRPGHRERPFLMYKFRTMSNSRDETGALLPDRDRLSKFGSWLRRTSVDELPALINIVFGEMSFIGPRPLLMNYLELYSVNQSRRHDVLPGLSGWAQINGRNAISWDDKLRLDVWYVDNQNFWLDLRILLVSVSKVLSREGISSPGYETSPPFLGNVSTHEKP